MWKLKNEFTDAAFHLKGKTLKGSELQQADINALIEVYDNPKTSPSGMKYRFFEFVQVTQPTKPTGENGK